MSWTWPQGIAHLRGGGIRLEALSPDHLADLTRAAATATEHEWHMGFVPPPQDMKVYVSRAIAREDGKLRRVVPMSDGTFADVAVFSVSDDEWASVKSTIVERLTTRRMP